MKNLKEHIIVRINDLIQRKRYTRELLDSDFISFMQSENVENHYKNIRRINFYYKIQKWIEKVENNKCTKEDFIQFLEDKKKHYIFVRINTRPVNSTYPSFNLCFQWDFDTYSEFIEYLDEIMSFINN
jgi:hypothetical protein